MHTQDVEHIVATSPELSFAVIWWGRLTNGCNSANLMPSGR